MAKNKNLTKIAIYEYDESLKKWIPFSWDETIEGQKLVTSYNRDQLFIGTVTVTTAGTAVQGPSVQVPAGFSIALIARPANTGNCFIGISQTGAQTSGTRATLQLGGPPLHVYVTNVNLLWFDAANSNDIVEIIVER